MNGVLIICIGVNDMDPQHWILYIIGIMVMYSITTTKGMHNGYWGAGASVVSLICLFWPLVLATVFIGYLLEGDENEED